MESIFVDTAALIALGNRHDDLHQKAQIIQKQLVAQSTQFVTTNFIIAEYCNAFSSVKLRAVAIATVESVLASPSWQYVHIEKQQMQQSFTLYKQMVDKNWGLVDCSSIVLAKQFNMRKIFTSDHHFEQAGFQILLN